MACISFDDKIVTIWSYISYGMVGVLFIIHFISLFLIRVSQLNNLYDSFEASPLFDFHLSDTSCLDREDAVVFHEWGGRIEWYWNNRRNQFDSKTVDKTNLTRLYGKYFCYTKISYKDLLYNNQIIKKGEQCSGKYNKNCGVIDTLGQELCIEEGNNCPLSDVGIDQNYDSENYYYENNIYYNKNGFNANNKTIIGKLILSEGQPCYATKDYLWRKFLSDEAVGTKLECSLEIFGKKIDDRYENKGAITYKRVYEDNLPSESKNEMLKKVGNQQVSLYKKIFLGINKECDEQSSITKEKQETLEYHQSNEVVMTYVEAIFITIVFGFASIGMIFQHYCDRCYISDCYVSTMGISSLINGLMIFVAFICRSIFLGKVISNTLEYDCSDEINNEFFRNESENTKKFIKITAVNLGGDVIFLFFNALALIYAIRDYRKSSGSNYSLIHH